MGWMRSIPSTPCAWWPPAQVQEAFLPWHAFSGWVLLSPAFRADLMVVGQCQEEAACCCAGPSAAFALPSSCALTALLHRELFHYSFCLLKRPLPPLAPQVSLFPNTFFFFSFFSSTKLIFHLLLRKMSCHSFFFFFFTRSMDFLPAFTNKTARPCIFTLSKTCRAVLKLIPDLDVFP